MSFTHKWFIPTTLFFFFFLSTTLGQGVLSNFRNDGFSENVLQNLTNFEVDAVAHSVVALNDSSVVITGLLRYPPNVLAHPSFTDEDDVRFSELSTDTHHFAGMVLRVLTNGTVAWAKRTALCTFETTFTAVYDGVHVYVAGASVAVPGENNQLFAGRVLMKYGINGARKELVRHGEKGERYTSISYKDSKPDTLFLVSSAPSTAEVYKNRGDKTPSENGLLVHRVRKRDLRVVKTEFVSDSSSVEGTLMKDIFWDMAVSHDGSSIFIAAYRETMRFGMTNFPAVFSIKSSDLSIETTNNMENELQLDMHIATRPDSEGVYVSYVDRSGNKEFLVIRRLTRSLVDLRWGEDLGSTVRYRIVLQSEILRETASSVRDVAVDRNGTVRVLLHSAEVVNATLAKETPPPSLAIHQQLKNGRPAYVVVTHEQRVLHVTQAQTEQRWEAFGMSIGEMEHVIVGGDRGLVNGGVSRVLLTGVKRHLVGPPEATPEPNETMEAPAEPGDGVDCIGVSTRIAGRSIVEVVLSDGRLRLQMHPGRRGRRVGVRCYGWNNGTEEVLCATDDHVVRHWGRVMYMKELCGMVGCEDRVEEVVNFKGGCGDEVFAHERLSVTMHAGGDDAKGAMKEECLMMGRWWSRWIWWLGSL